MCPSIGSQSGIGAILAMDSPDASSRAIGRPSGDLEKRGGEEGGWWRERGLFFRGVEDEDCWFCYTGTAVVNAPGRQKAVAAFLGTGRSWPHRER